MPVERWFRGISRLNFNEPPDSPNRAAFVNENQQSQHSKTGWITAFVLTLFVALCVSLTPWYPEWLRHGVMEVFSFVCHQLPGRSPHVDGVQLAVCHRCLGIYWALPAAAVLYGLTRGLRLMKGRRTLNVVLLAGVPAAVDWSGDVLGFWMNTPISRIITGAIFGLVAGYILAEGISDIVKDRQSDKSGPAEDN